MSRRLCFLTVAALLTLSIGISKGDTFTTFSIGNSLTVDSNVQVMTEMAAGAGITATADQFTQSGVGLDVLWGNSAGYQTGLANPLNAVTLEPFLGQLTGPNTGTPPSDSGDINRAVDFMNFAKNANPANVNTQFYIFARWSEASVWNSLPGGYDQRWTTPYDPNDNTLVTTQTGDYFNQLVAGIRAAQPSDMKPIELIPTGYVFDAIAKALNNNDPKLATIANAGGLQSLYRDDLHLSNGTMGTNTLGDFIATTTFYSTIFHESPEGLVPPSEFPSLDPTTVGELESIIWDVVSTNTDTGVPEPTSMTLLLGAGALAAMSRRRQSAAAR